MKIFALRDNIRALKHVDLPVELHVEPLVKTWPSTHIAGGLSIEAAAPAAADIEKCGTRWEMRTKEFHGRVILGYWWSSFIPSFFFNNYRETLVFHEQWELFFLFWLNRNFFIYCSIVLLVEKACLLFMIFLLRETRSDFMNIKYKYDVPINVYLEFITDLSNKNHE